MKRNRPITAMTTAASDAERDQLIAMVEYARELAKAALHDLEATGKVSHFTLDRIVGLNPPVDSRDTNIED